nr:uncharacterized protein LOC117840742 [Setaria viridis]
MCELLKHGAKPSDDIIQLSSVIRMCALSLVYLREPQSIASAAAMVGMANEAKRMCDWMKRENRLITLSLPQPRELHRSCLIRMKALDVMTRIQILFALPQPRAILMLFQKKAPAPRLQSKTRPSPSPTNLMLFQKKVPAPRLQSKTRPSPSPTNLMLFQKKAPAPRLQSKTRPIPSAGPIPTRLKLAQNWKSSYKM